MLTEFERIALEAHLRGKCTCPDQYICKMRIDELVSKRNG